MTDIDYNTVVPYYILLKKPIGTFKKASNYNKNKISDIKLPSSLMFTKMIFGIRLFEIG